MTDIRVPWRPAAGEVLIIEPEAPPITVVSALMILPRRVDAPAGVLLTVRLLAPRDFEWRRISNGEPIQVGAVSRFTRPAGFEFDVFGLLAGGAQAVVYTDSARDRMVITQGFYLVDYQEQQIKAG